MTILRPGKKRRDPIGEHECWHCACQFVIQHADPLPPPNDRGEIWFKCPSRECGMNVEVNKFVESPAP